MKFQITVKLLLFAVVLIFSCVHDSYTQTPSTRFDFTITLSDGVQLDCTKFVPGTQPPKNGYPCILCCHGFGLTKEVNFELAMDESKWGFYTFCYSMRGQGNSGGYSNLISTTEMNDFMQVIQFIKDDSNTDDDRIAVDGGSQGGIIPFMAACNGAKIRCLVTELASPEFASDWIANGCVKMTLLWTLSYDNTIVRYNDEVKQYRDWTVSGNKDDWDKLAYNLPKDRDFIDKVKDSQVPVLISNTWQDKFFNTIGMIKIKDELRVPYKMYFGSIKGHGGEINVEENNAHGILVNDWFYYWLRDRQNNVMDNKFTYDVTSFSGTTLNFTQYKSPIWPPEGVSNIKFYFGSNNHLSTVPNNNPSQPYSVLKNEVYDSKMTLLNAVYMSFVGPFESKFRKDEVIFDTDALDKDARMVGTPQVKLFYSSDADLCQFNFQIWEVSPEGTENFITSVNYTDRYYTPENLSEKLIDGVSYGHIFKKGSKIRIKVTNLDTRPNDNFLRTFPYVLPVLRNATNKIYMSNDNQSYISIPLLQ